MPHEARSQGTQPGEHDFGAMAVGRERERAKRE